MKKKFSLKEWLDKPWTNRSYIQYCAGAAAIGTVIGAIWAAVAYRGEIHDWAEDKVETVKGKFG